MMDVIQPWLQFGNDSFVSVRDISHILRNNVGKDKDQYPLRIYLCSRIDVNDYITVPKEFVSQLSNAIKQLEADGLIRIYPRPEKQT